jgi:hypothetical protein
MSFNVRIFAYSGIVATKQPQIVQQSQDSVFLLRDPYLAGQKLPSTGATPVLSAALPKGTGCLRVEVDDGNQIRYEIQMGPNSGGNARAPGTNSPILSGRDIVFASENAIFAFVDASAV